MSDRNRLFIAIWPDQEVLRATRAADPWIEGLDDFRITPPRLRHVTALFIGDADPETESSVIAAAERIASETPVFETRLVGLGALPQVHRVRIIAALLDLESPLPDLMRRLSEEAPAGGDRRAAKQRRAPRPHITLARVRSRRRPRRVDLRSAPELEGRLQVDRLDLVHSTLTSDGPIYETVETFYLAGSPGRDAAAPTRRT